HITQDSPASPYRPGREIAAAAQTGPAPTIITGMSVALECTAIPTIVISLAILGSYVLGRATGIPGAALFGTAVATMGMLATAAYIHACDNFRPITDKAGGIGGRSHQPEDIRKKTDRLDAVGNTTKALTKGYAIGSAALAAFLLFSAYLDEVRNYGFKIETVDIAKPEIFVGGLLGAMLVFLFSALAIRAVGKAAYYVINDVRAQFKEKPGILAGTERPDYGRCVDIVTRGALRQMVLPGILAVAMPIVVGVIFKAVFHAGAEAVAALFIELVWGPVRCSRATRAARFRCPQTPSAGLSALALGLPLIWGPVQCSRATRAARFRCPQTPSAGLSALALGLPLIGGPS